MSTEALNLAASIKESRRNRPRASRSHMPCLVCGNPISAENCRPFRQLTGDYKVPEGEFHDDQPPFIITRKPAELVPVGHFVEDELEQRGWSRNDLVLRIGGDVVINKIALDLLIDAPTKGMLVGRDMAEDLARVFGTSVELWLSLDAAWQQQRNDEPNEPAAVP